MRVLCTNDDGEQAVGLRALVEAASALGEVWVVAPAQEQSATSHALTLHRPIGVHRVRPRAFRVEGTPTDCVLLAVHELLDPKPDLVLSGVNHGHNLGEDVLYSGTVAAAVEATLLGIPAMAISYAGDEPDAVEAYVPLLRRLLRELLQRWNGTPPDHLWNVNLPAVPPDRVRGVRFTRLGRRVYAETIVRSVDPAGREYYWIGGGIRHWSGTPDSDVRAVHAGYISVTPLHLDWTHVGALARAARDPIEGFA
jgi:5'-nucleotidase